MFVVNSVYREPVMTKVGKGLQFCYPETFGDNFIHCKSELSENQMDRLFKKNSVGDNFL